MLLDNLTTPAILNPVAAFCGDAGLATQEIRRNEKPRLSLLARSGFLVRDTWQALLWAGCVGGVMPCRFLVSGSLTRTVPPTLFSDRKAGLTRMTRSSAMTHNNTARTSAQSVSASLKTTQRVERLEDAVNLGAIGLDWLYSVLHAIEALHERGEGSAHIKPLAELGRYIASDFGESLAGVVRK